MKRANVIVLGVVVAWIFISVFSVCGQGTAPIASAPGAPAGSYGLSDLDTINLFNGDLNFDLPLINVSGRGGSSQKISLNLQTQFDLHGTLVSPNGPIVNYNIGPRPHFPLELVGAVAATSNPPFQDMNDPCVDNPYNVVYYVHHQLNLKYIEPNGTEHMLGDPTYHGKPFELCGEFSINYGRVFQSSDGSFIIFVADADIQTSTYMPHGPTGYLYFKNGTKSRIDDGKILWTEDRNGNKIEYTYNNNSVPQVTKITDSLSREINIEYGVTEAAPYGLCDKITYKGSGGADRILRLSYDSLHNVLRTTQPSDSSTIKTMGELFGAGILGENGDYDPLEVTKLWLPDGRSYQFKYNVYGRLARVTLPTGGSTEYDSSTPQGGSNVEYVNSVASYIDLEYVEYRVIEKRVYDENNALQLRTTFTKTDPCEGYPTSCSTSVIVENLDASNNRLDKVKHYFYSVPGGLHEYEQRWNDGKEYKTEYYGSNGSTLLRKIEMDWEQRVPSWCYNNEYLGGNVCGVANAWMPDNNSFLAQTTTTITDGNLVSKVSSVNPSTGDWAFDQFSNPTDTWYYDYGTGAPGSFLKRVHIDYVTDPNYVPFTGVNMTSLPLQTWVSSDSAGNSKVSLTQFEYDNYASNSTHAPLWPRSSVVEHDATNYGTGFAYRGNVTGVTSYSNAASQTGAVSTYSKYDILGNIVKTIDANGNATTISYDDNFGSPDDEATTNSAPSHLSGLNTFAFPTSTTNLLGTAYAQYDYYTGAPVNSRDFNGVISKVAYNDPLDRPTQKVTAVGTLLEAQSTTVYDDASRRIQTTSDLKALNDNLLKSESYYDGLGRTVESRRYEADGGYVSVQTVPSLTVQDPVSSQWRAASKTSNPFRPNVGETAVWTTSLNDELGRPIKVITPDNAIVKTDYSGNATTVTDQAGKLRRSITNALGQLTRVDEPDLTSPAGALGSVSSPYQPTTYSYDALNNLLTVTQASSTTAQCGGASNCSQTRTFTYNSLSRLLSAANPESGTINYAYDADGNLTSKTDARSITTTYAYDALNRVTSRSYNDSPQTPTVSYTYGTTAPAIGKLTKVSSSVSTTEYTSFDILGRVTGHKQTTDGTDYTTGYTYNLAGVLDEETYPSGRVVKNELNNDGTLSMVESRKDASHGYWSYANSFTYNPAGAVTSMQLGNGKWESTTFNGRLQPTQIALGTTNTGTLAYDQLKLNYDYGTTANNGNVQTQTITVPGMAYPLIQTYTYDSLNRLANATEASNSSQTWKQAFTYDRYGNRNFDEANTTTLVKNCGAPPNFTVCTADKKVSDPAVSTANNRLSTGDNYAFDNAGNTTADAQSRTFVYDAENKQTSVSDGSGTIGQYWYDGDGKRIKKNVSSTGETTVFVYDAGGKEIAEYSTIFANSTDAKVSYLTSDTLGSPRIDTDQNGVVTARHDYMPFGEEIDGTGGRTTGLHYGDDTVRKQFTGYERDGETDLDFAGARYLNYALGRFSVPDPLGSSSKRSNPQTFNRYIYVLDNPLLLVDANGMDPTISFTLYIRAFAHEDWFGLRMFRGDNRGFSVDPSASHKVGSATQVIGGDNINQLANEGDISTTLTTALPAALSGMYIGIGTINVESECYVRQTNDYLSSQSINSEGSDVAFDIYGNNDAFVDTAIIGSVWAGYGNSVLTADIDLHPDISFTYGHDGDGNITSITASGSVTGDGFPDAEAFVRDSQGNGVMLGTFAHPSDASPFGSLPLNNSRPMISVPETTINVQNGIFVGVTYQGTRYTIDDWNRRMGVVGQSQ